MEEIYGTMPESLQHFMKQHDDIMLFLALRDVFHLLDLMELSDREKLEFRKLTKTGEIQIEEGLRYCGTEEEYMDTLRFYAANAPVAVNEIHSLWSDGNLADTTVKVHAIKSMSRCIGALSIGDLAEKLEQAGKAGDANALGARLDELLARIRKLCSEIHQM
jgi:HPt (histidine-containing phosphotransfer) domain-containing protein